MNVGIVPLLSTIVSFVFALTVLDQYFAKRKTHQLIWAIGLFMYAISTLTEFWTETYGLNITMYRLWYLFGAIYVAAYLGMGTAFLLLRKRTAQIIFGILLVTSIWAAYAVFSAKVDLSTINSLTGKAMPTSVRLLTPFFNTFGTLFLVGGAIYCAVIFWRKRILFNRVISNVLIAVGALLPAVGGGIVRFGGTQIGFYFLELAGIVIIFIGFLKTKEVFGFFRFPLIHGFKKVGSDKGA